MLSELSTKSDDKFDKSSIIIIINYYFMKSTFILSQQFQRHLLWPLEDKEQWLLVAPSSHFSKQH